MYYQFNGHLWHFGGLKLWHFAKFRTTTLTLCGESHTIAQLCKTKKTMLNEDGWNIAGYTCGPDEFQCQKGCIPKRFVCDNYFDCSDGFDEQNCIPSTTRKSGHRASACTKYEEVSARYCLATETSENVVVMTARAMSCSLSWAEPLFYVRWRNRRHDAHWSLYWLEGIFQSLKASEHKFYGRFHRIQRWSHRITSDDVMVLLK